MPKRVTVFVTGRIWCGGRRKCSGAIGFMAGSYVLNYRTCCRSGTKQTAAAKLMGLIRPIADPRTQTFGAALEISPGR